MHNECNSMATQSDGSSEHASVILHRKASSCGSSNMLTVILAVITVSKRSDISVSPWAKASH